MSLASDQTPCLFFWIFAPLSFLVRTLPPSFSLCLGFCASFQKSALLLLFAPPPLLLVLFSSGLLLFPSTLLPLFVCSCYCCSSPLCCRCRCYFCSCCSSPLRAIAAVAALPFWFGTLQVLLFNSNRSAILLAQVFVPFPH